MCALGLNQGIQIISDCRIKQGKKSYERHHSTMSYNIFFLIRRWLSWATFWPAKNRSSSTWWVTRWSEETTQTSTNFLDKVFETWRQSQPKPSSQNHGMPVLVVDVTPARSEVMTRTSSWIVEERKKLGNLFISLPKMPPILLVVTKLWNESR